MKVKLRLAFVSLSWLLSSQVSWAGCGDTSTQCLVVEDGSESSIPCDITVCANVSDYISQWKLSDGSSVSVYLNREGISTIEVNGKAGVSIPYNILKENLTCYGTADLSSVYCEGDVSL